MARQRINVPAGALRIAKGISPSPDVSFDLAALTADRVVTVPDANVDLGSILGSAQVLALLASTDPLLLGAFLSTVRAAGFFQQLGDLGGGLTANLNRGWNVVTLAPDGVNNFVETPLFNGSQRVYAYAHRITTTISGDSVARLDVGTATDPDAFTPIQINNMTGGTGNAQLVAFASGEPGIATLRVSFYKADGTTPAIPTAGSMKVGMFLENVSAL